MKAYILIKMRPGDIPEALRQLRQAKGVDTAKMIFGPYDLILEVQAPDLDALGRLLAHEVQPTPGVLETITCLEADI